MADPGWAQSPRGMNDLGHDGDVEGAPGVAGPLETSGIGQRHRHEEPRHREVPEELGPQIHPRRDPLPSRTFPSRASGTTTEEGPPPPLPPPVPIRAATRTAVHGPVRAPCPPGLPATAAVAPMSPTAVQVMEGGRAGNKPVYLSVTIFQPVEHTPGSSGASLHGGRCKAVRGEPPPRVHGHRPWIPVGESEAEKPVGCDDPVRGRHGRPHRCERHPVTRFPEEQSPPEGDTTESDDPGGMDRYPDSRVARPTRILPGAGDGCPNSGMRDHVQLR